MTKPTNPKREFVISDEQLKTWKDMALNEPDFHVVSNPYIVAVLDLIQYVETLESENQGMWHVINDQIGWAEG